MSNKRGEGYIQVGVETYGGGLWHTCKPSRCFLERKAKFLGFDRDLGVAGRAMVRTEDGSIVQKLIKIDRPSMLIDAAASSSL